MDEQAKAAQEVAKTIGKGIDVATRAGQFISDYIKAPLEQAFGIYEDKLRYIRWERRVRLMDRSTQFLRERGLSHPTRSVSMNIAIPILQLGSMEEDDELQDRWAHLLVNAADTDSGITVQASFIGILQNLSSFDALILEKIYSVTEAPGFEKLNIWTMKLPETVHVSKSESIDKVSLPREVELSLGNLDRLGLIQSAMAWGGATLYCVHQTVLGQEFMKACSGQTI